MPTGTNEFNILTFGDFGVDPTEVGEIVYKNGSFLLKTATGIVDLRVASSPTYSDVQIFTSSGTWTKPATATMVQVIAVGAGGGGGGGGQGAATANDVYGGAGGGGGGSARNYFVPASMLNNTEAVTIGAGGLGGAGAAVAETTGVAGNAGGTSTFGPVGNQCRVLGGGGGGGGGPATIGTAGSGRAADWSTVGNGTNGAASNSTAAGNARWSPSGGGRGAPYFLGPTFSTPSAGSGNLASVGTTNPGGVVGLGSAGGNGNPAVTNSGWGGTGGGGGDYGFAGGNGGYPGGGGGGGGAALTGITGGNGGNGADALMIIISW